MKPTRARALVLALLATTAAVTTGACGEPAPALEIHIVKAGDTDPFGAATTVRTRLVDQAGGVVSESSFAIAEGRGGFPEAVPFGTLRAVVETLNANGDPVARGSSRARVLAGGDVSFSVFVGVLDAFFATIDTSGAPTAITEPVVGLTATALEDGTVLITGGARLGDGGAIAGISDKAYLFDQDTGAFQDLGTMTQARAGHTATILKPVNGKRIVLITGGVTVVNSQVQASATAELYDPSNRSFTLVPAPLAEPRAFHTATLLIDGGVLLAGGMQPVPQALADAPRWDQLAAMEAPTVAERFSNDPSAALTVIAGGLEAGRWGHAAVRADQTGRVLLVGGRGMDGNALATTTVFDPGAAAFSLGPILSAPRAGVSIVRLPDDRVMAIGGRSVPADPLSALASTDLLEVGGNTRTDGPTLAAGRAWQTATLLTDGRVLVAGGLGADGAARADAEIVGATGATRITSGGLRRARALHAAAALPGDLVLLVAGSDVAGATWTALQTGEVFVDPLE